MMRPRRRRPGPCPAPAAACRPRLAWMPRGGDGRPRPSPEQRTAAMKINKWVLAAVLFLFAAGMYAAVIFKMS